MVPILRGDPAVLADPRRHRVAYLIEKPAASGGVDTCAHSHALCGRAEL